MAVYDYGFIKSDRPLTEAELARERARLSIGPLLGNLQEYYRRKYGGATPVSGGVSIPPTPRPEVLANLRPATSTVPVAPAMQAFDQLLRSVRASLPQPGPSSVLQSTIADILEQRRKTFPEYMPYPAGTPTQQAKLDKLASALQRTETFGKVVNEEDAKTLGVPVGTPTWEAQNAAAERAHELRLEAMGAAVGGGGGGKLSSNEAVGQLSEYYKKALDDVWAKAGPQGPTREQVLETLYEIERDMSQRWPSIRQFTSSSGIRDVWNYLFSVSGVKPGEYEEWKKKNQKSLDFLSAIGLSAAAEGGLELLGGAGENLNP